ncbi:MAG: cyclic nucleotide-binding domain-containing protein [Thermodesulfobacteriota bacterium]|nr:cyclic nucleotide-binding domain-containing protein [Thermodesulfobacteriota bacterium]
MISEEMLKNFDFFSNMDKEKLAEISQLSETHEYNSGDIIFNQGEKAENIYGLLDGEVELRAVFNYKTITKNIQYEESVHTMEEIIERSIKVATIGPNLIFLWSAFVKPHIATSTAICSEDSRAFVLPAYKIKEMLEKDPAFGYMFMVKLSEVIYRRLGARTDKLVEIWGHTFDAGEID